VGSVAIVHNGIIENYRELKEELSAEGATFSSDTDSELLAHMMKREISKKGDMLKAALAVIPRLEGAYSVLVMSDDEPDKILTFKNGPPMLVGLGQGEILFASDVQAVIEHTNKIIYVEDDEVALSQKGDVQFYDLKGQSIKKEIHEVKWDSAMAEKAGFDHFMLKEIFEQPRSLIQTMDKYLKHSPLRVDFGDCGFSESDFKKFKAVQIIACGSAWHAALVSKYVFEKEARISVQVEIASEFRYRSPVMDPDTLVIFVSQSGETADTLACLRLCKKMGLKTLTICNVQRSTMEREADGHLNTFAGPEIGVCSTKALTTQILVLEMLAFHMAFVRQQITAAVFETHLQALLALPSQVEVCLNHDKWFKEVASSLSQYRCFLFIGRGINYPIALEGALKLKEITYLHAEGYPSGEMKHGPIALVGADMAIIAIAPRDDLYAKNISNIEEVRARGGQIFGIGTAEDETLKNLSKHYIGVPASSWTGNSILMSIPVQLLSYHFAVALGRDVDQPRNLAKSVTVE